tara:strand:- start:29210 stop:29719 length:510 start_codon:yes stop_codon:yes gene_type:complete
MKILKKIAGLAAAMCLLIGGISAQEAKSPAKETTGTIGDMKVEVKYCAPSVRGRDIYGDLVPFGKVWRAGANDATTITFAEDCKVEGKKVKAGTYAFFVTPKESGEWEIMLNSEAKQWGAYKMNPKKNIVVAEVTAIDADKAEQLSYEVTEDGIQLHWDTKMINVEVSN